MLPQKMTHIIRRIREMGVGTAIWLCHHRLKKYRFAHTWRRKIHKGLAGHSWHEIANRHHVPHFALFLRSLKTDVTWARLHNDLFTPTPPPSTPDVALPSSWHYDMSCTIPSPAAWRTAFYTDVTIPETAPSHERGPDIKVPWDLSRLQYLVVLGYTHQHAPHTSHTLRNYYVTTFINHINSWRTNNPFLRGVNWANPMEVSIRSINLLWAFYFFKNAEIIPHDFWQSYICMLYDHLVYLEHNWEVSDRPNNHYLTDLVGYLYLCTFFRSVKKYDRKRTRIARIIFAQFDHQLLPDGTSYEGSTHYHNLITELATHTRSLCIHTNTTIPSIFEHHYQRMLQFVGDCTDQSNSLVRIGDEDGGTIMAQELLQSSSMQQPHATHPTQYPNFGISIITTPTVHLTFRHPTYHQRQPTGHFHNDALSFTLSLKGFPLFVDPGTYCYTAHAAWRNYFRSAAAHNTFYITNGIDAHNLFVLARPERQPSSSLHNNNGVISIHDYHDLALELGLRAHRELSYSEQKKEICMSDWFEYYQQKDTTLLNVPIAHWSLHCAPGITIKQQDQFTWILSTAQQTLACITSSLRWETKEDFFSPIYGVKESSITLTASAEARGTHYLNIRQVD
jgi:hypothetical protein